VAANDVGNAGDLIGRVIGIYPENIPAATTGEGAMSLGPETTDAYSFRKPWSDSGRVIKCLPVHVVV
jgi:hypothetical protein